MFQLSTSETAARGDDHGCVPARRIGHVYADDLADRMALTMLAGLLAAAW
jgi:hypothetical protein